jgi:hypothetical protein
MTIPSIQFRPPPISRYVRDQLPIDLIHGEEFDNDPLHGEDPKVLEKIYVDMTRSFLSPPLPGSRESSHPQAHRSSMTLAHTGSPTNASNLLDHTPATLLEAGVIPSLTINDLDQKFSELKIYLESEGINFDSEAGHNYARDCLHPGPYYCLSEARSFLDITPEHSRPASPRLQLFSLDDLPITVDMEILPQETHPTCLYEESDGSTISSSSCPGAASENAHD